MKKHVTYKQLRDILGGERECSLSTNLGLSALLHKRRREVPRTDQDGNATNSSYYYQLVVVDIRNPDNRVALNRYDKLVYDTRTRDFGVIPGPGSFECPIRNLMAYTTLGQKIVDFRDDAIECPSDAFVMIHGQAAVSKTRTGRTISGGDLILVFSGPFDNPVVHRRYRIETIVVRNGIDKEPAAAALKRFLSMLLDESGQTGPLQEYFVAERCQREVEEAAESAARIARRQARDAAAKVKRLTNERVTGFLGIIVDIVGDGTPRERRFDFGGKTFQIDKPWNGKAEYSTIAIVNGRGNEIVPILTLVESGALQAWAEGLDPLATQQLVHYYDEQLGATSEATPVSTHAHENPDDESGS